MTVYTGVESRTDRIVVTDVVSFTVRLLCHPNYKTLPIPLYTRLESGATASLCIEKNFVTKILQPPFYL